MLKNINIRNIPEPIFYKAQEIKAKLLLKSWAELLETLLRTYEESQK